MDVFLADDSPQVRSALRLLLEQQPGLRVAGEAASGDELLAITGETCPALILLDWELPGLRGRDLVAALRDRCPAAAVIAMSSLPDVRQVALAAGVDAFAGKTEPPEHLLAMLRSAVDALRANIREGSQPEWGWKRGTLDDGT